MFQHPDFSPSSSVLHSTAVSHYYYPLTEREVPVAVTMTSLDKFVENLDKKLEPEVLIKLDVQGYEDRVIRGGRKCFAGATTCISEVNFDLLYDERCTFRGIWMLFDSLGYRYAGNVDQTYAPDGHIIYVDAMFPKEANGSQAGKGLRGEWRTSRETVKHPLQLASCLGTDPNA